MLYSEGEPLWRLLLLEGWWVVIIRQIDRSPPSIQLTCGSKVFRSMRGMRMTRIGQKCRGVVSDPGIVSLPLLHVVIINNLPSPNPFGTLENKGHRMPLI